MEEKNSILVSDTMLVSGQGCCFILGGACIGRQILHCFACGTERGILGKRPQCQTPKCRWRGHIFAEKGIFGGEEMEKRRYGQKSNGKKRNRNKGPMILLFVIFLAAAVFFASSRGKRENISVALPPEGSGISERSMTEENTEEGNTEGGNTGEWDLEGDRENEEKWCLELVNRWNPMKTDGSEVETVTLSNGERVDTRIYPQLQSMFDAARQSGVYPIVASGFRTRSEQEEIYYEKISAYEAEGYSDAEAKEEAERWVAVPGTSEHQLGLAVDINADGIYSTGDQVYTWLAENAHKFGFIYRYPSDKTEITGVANEPWHYRYVGVTAAGEIHRQGICLEEYLAETKGMS